MFREASIWKLTFMGFLVVILILTVSLGAFFIHEEYRRFDADSAALENGYLRARKGLIRKNVQEIVELNRFEDKRAERRVKELLRNRVMEAYAIAMDAYEKNRNRRTGEEIKRIVKEKLQDMRFDNGQGYYFATTGDDGDEIIAIEPELAGRALKNVTDTSAEAVVRTMVGMVTGSEEGFFSYMAPKPRFPGAEFPKLSFIKYFEPFGWYIGTGVYLDDVKRDVQRYILERMYRKQAEPGRSLFIFRYDGTVLYNDQKQYIGRNMLNQTDAEGREFYRELLRLGREPGGGYVSYAWENPVKGRPAPKIAYADSYPDWQWIIAMEANTDDIGEVLERKKAALGRQVNSYVGKIMLMLLGFIALGTLLSLYFSKKLGKEFEVFKTFFRDAAAKLKEIDEDNLKTREFREMAVSANQMIEGRKQAEEEMKHLQDLLNNIIDSMPSVLVGVDANGMVTQWNREAEEATGTTAGEARGGTLADVFTQLADQMHRVRQTIRDREAKTEEKIARVYDGETRFEDITIYPLISNGVKGAVIRVDDVTERVRMEEMMIQSEKMLTVGGLAAGMAHEINNPLAGILQNAQVVLNRISKDLPANRQAAAACGTSMEAIRSFMEKRDIPKMLEAIRSSGGQAAHIVENMLSFSRKSEAVFHSRALSDLLDKTVELASKDYDLKKKYDFRQIEIVREYDPDLQDVACEETKIQQVILNLLKNAAQCMAKQIDRVEPPRMTLRLIKDGHMARIEVEDNGSGMSEKDRKRIFEPFFTTKDVGEGTGLGLSVSYFIIAENHGGSMTVESAPGKGSKFIIRLPLSKTKI
jgi:two-component system, NtrC family, sensor kinase